MDPDWTHAERAGRHAWRNPDGSLRGKRIENLRRAGVEDEAGAARLAYEVRTALDTRCFRGAHGREVFANDRLSTIHVSHDDVSKEDTIFVNDHPSLKASERIAIWAERERRKYNVAALELDGGSRALDTLRQSEREAVKAREDPFALAEQRALEDMRAEEKARSQTRRKKRDPERGR